jgi:inner membrane protein
MTDVTGLAARIPTRSMGLKLLLVCALALLMSVPALFVFALLMDRTHRAEQVTREVGQLVGGEQSFLGPVIVVPYQVPAATPGQPPTLGVYVVFPARADAAVDARTEVRRRSLFQVPVFTADLDFRASFDLTGVPLHLPAGATPDWSRAQLLVGVSDPRGAQNDIVVTAGGKTFSLAPASALADETPEVGGGLRFFGAEAGELIQPGAKFDARARLRFTGAKRLAVLPFGKATTLRMTSDWPNPSFDGGFLPAKRQITDHGFTASWSVPFIARGVPAAGGRDLLAKLAPTDLGVSFVQPTDPYQSVGRSLKYALLFVGLVFLAYFLFETRNRRRVHPAQYVLIGLAQVIFYLLLLSLSEQVGFDLAFLIAAGATVCLISAYAGWVFASRAQGAVALAAFSVLYGLIYVLMRLEDEALLVGAVASFAAIAAVMYFTRRLDWYGVTDQAARGSA